MKFDALTEYGTFLDKHEGCDWVAGLPVYQHLYNTTHHTSIDINTGRSPFEVFYGRPSNYERNILGVGGEQEVRIFWSLTINNYSLYIHSLMMMMMMIKLLSSQFRLILKQYK